MSDVPKSQSNQKKYRYGRANDMNSSLGPGKNLSFNKPHQVQTILGQSQASIQKPFAGFWLV